MHNLVYWLYAAIIFFSATVVFDVIHYLLHIWRDSRFSVLRYFAKMHWGHHEFLNQQLEINPDFQAANIKYHVIPEYVTQVMITVLYLWVFPWVSVAIALAFETMVFSIALATKGVDPNHLPKRHLKKPHNFPIVGPHYHGYHHVYPNSYFSSYIKIVDWILGAAMELKGKRIVISGAGGGLGSALVKQLKVEGVASIDTLKYGLDYRQGDFSKIDEKLIDKDILILAHGAKRDAMWANCTSFQTIIERFLELNKDHLTVPEVWGAGSEIECHPAVLPAFYPYKRSKRAYANWTKQYMPRQRVIYRHIVPAAFTSNMGVGLMSSAFVAKTIISRAKRDWRYIPITYTGIAWLNYIKYRLMPVSRRWLSDSLKTTDS